jgi:hypothetical protein
MDIETETPFPVITCDTYFRRSLLLGPFISRPEALRQYLTLNGLGKQSHPAQFKMLREIKICVNFLQS